MNDLRSPKISNSVTSCCRLKEGQWWWDMLWKGGTSFRSISCHSTDMSPQCLCKRPPLYPASSISRTKTKQKINGHDKMDRVLKFHTERRNSCGIKTGSLCRLGCSSSSLWFWSVLWNYFSTTWTLLYFLLFWFPLNWPNFQGSRHIYIGRQWAVDVVCVCLM